MLSTLSIEEILFFDIRVFFLFFRDEKQKSGLWDKSPDDKKKDKRFLEENALLHFRPILLMFENAFL
jgi:hypothetical protein